MNPHFSFIFLGDTHGFINDFIKQKEIIEIIHPDFVLSESLQNISLDSKERYIEILRTKKISEMVSFEEVNDLINLCNKKDINLIGIDLENFGFDKSLQKKIKNNIALSEDEEFKMNEILKRRSEHQLKMIKDFKKKTEKPIIIIVGSWHLRKDSLLMKSLDNYKVIFPCDSKGSLLIEPPKNKNNISYCERIK